VQEQQRQRQQLSGDGASQQQQQRHRQRQAIYSRRYQKRQAVMGAAAKLRHAFPRDHIVVLHMSDNSSKLSYFCGGPAFYTGEHIQHKKAFVDLARQVLPAGAQAFDASLASITDGGTGGSQGIARGGERKKNAWNVFRKQHASAVYMELKDANPGAGRVPSAELNAELSRRYQQLTQGEKEALLQPDAMTGPTAAEEDADMEFTAASAQRGVAERAVGVGLPAGSSTSAATAAAGTLHPDLVAMPGSAVLAELRAMAQELQPSAPDDQNEEIRRRLIS
jgi:hypothetical protein